MFDVKKTTEDLIQWIKDWFEENGKGCNAVLGISGGKDSTIVAALLAKALGSHRVIGVAMPEDGQGINGADAICKYLGIRYVYAPIGGIIHSFGLMHGITLDPVLKWSNQSEQNIPPRVRMTMLYAIAQSNNGRVAGTCNLSEDYVGYFTKHGDGASDFEPLADLTVTEILQIGDYLGLPYEWVHRLPSDGLPHSTDDQTKWGFTYEVLDKYIRGYEEPNAETKAKIDSWHNRNLFKLRPIKKFESGLSKID